MKKVYAIGEKILDEVYLSTRLTRDIDLWWSGNYYFRMSAESYGGKCEIIYNGLLKRLFTEGYEERLDDNTLFRYDKNISHAFSIDGNDSLEEMYWVTRGRTLPHHEYGAMYEIKPKYYEGFPLDLVFLMTPPVTFFPTPKIVESNMILYPGQAVLDTLDRTEVVSIDCGSGGTEILQTRHTYYLDTEVYRWSREENTGEVPDHPFYIRWIGRLGGYEHMMLTCKQKYTASLDKIDTYEKADETGIIRTINAESSVQVSASTGIVSRETLEIVSHIIESPYIQYYDKERERWVTIQLNKSTKINWNSDQSQGEAVLTFNLPNETYTD